MSVTGRTLYDKIKELIPGLSTSITPEILNKLCDDDTVQPFLNWFCQEINSENVVSEEDIRIMNRLKANGQWLEGKELEESLQEKIKDHPELLQLVELNVEERDEVQKDLERKLKNHKQDIEYLSATENSLNKLKDHDEKLAEQIEYNENLLEKERIELNKEHSDCLIALEQFDNHYKIFLKDIEELVNVYTAAAGKRGEHITWAQLPLDLFTKNTEMYIKYLDSYIKREISTKNNDDNHSSGNSDSPLDYDSLISDSYETTKDEDEKLKEVSWYKAKFQAAKKTLIFAKVEEEVAAKLLEIVKDTYNNMEVQIPQNSAQLRMENLELISKRNNLEEELQLLQEGPLEQVAEEFAESRMAKVFENNARAKLERRQKRLEKLQKILNLARESGSVFTNLLYVLIVTQIRKVDELAEFVKDAHYYLNTEYCSSSTRTDIMMQQQREYNSIIKSSDKNRNSFNHIFIPMLSLNNESYDESLNSAIENCDKLIDGNKAKIQSLLEDQQRITGLQTLAKEITGMFNEEVDTTSTRTLKPVPYKLQVQMEKSSLNIQQVQNDVLEVRNKLKEEIKKNSSSSLQRNMDILWQWFMADPETLMRKCEEAEELIKNQDFTKNL